MAAASGIQSFPSTNWVILLPEKEKEFNHSEERGSIPLSPVQSFHPQMLSPLQDRGIAHLSDADAPSGRANQVGQKVFREAKSWAGKFLKRTETHKPFTSSSYRHLLEYFDRIDFKRLTPEQQAFLRLKFACCEMYYFISEPGRERFFSAAKEAVLEQVEALEELTHVSESITRKTQRLIKKMNGWIDSYLQHKS